MTKIDLLKYLEEIANEVRKDRKQYRRNKHLCGISKAPSKEDVDAVLVNFINTVAHSQGVDYGLHIKDLK